MDTEIIRPKSDLMLRAASEINELCSEIKKLGISFFGHTRIFKDGSRIDLTNNAEMIEEFYFGKDKFFETYTPELNPQSITKQPILLDNLDDTKAFKFLREQHNIAHMLFKIEQHESYYDAWNFGTVRGNKGITQVYLNNLDILLLFTYLYKDKCHNLIASCEKDPIMFKHRASELLPEGSNLEVLNMKSTLLSKINRLYLKDNNQYLTKTEIECCHWICQGKTSGEIAIITEKSTRTIEKHIDNIKIKLSCDNKGQLIKILKELCIF